MPVAHYRGRYRATRAELGTHARTLKLTLHDGTALQVSGHSPLLRYAPELRRLRARPTRSLAKNAMGAFLAARLVEEQGDSVRSVVSRCDGGFTTLLRDVRSAQHVWGAVEVVLARLPSPRFEPAFCCLLRALLHHPRTRHTNRALFCWELHARLAFPPEGPEAAANCATARGLLQRLAL